MEKQNTLMVSNILSYLFFF